MTTSALFLAEIRRDGGTQPRVATDFNYVQQLAEDLARGACLPPVIVFFDGTDYWLADGFHRWHATEVVGAKDIGCDIRQGTRRDAILYSVSANATHGVRRTNADKRRAVLVLLNDTEWAQWSDREIARRCGVDNKTVSSLRPVHAEEIPQSRTRTFIHPKTGAPAQMNTTRIGSAPRPEANVTVFDSTSMSSEEDPTSPIEPWKRGMAPSTVEKFEQVNTNGFMFNALQEIDQQFQKLPPARECADQYPVLLRHTVSTERLREISAWLAAFADAWDARSNGGVRVAAE
jgi:hypothetical protein